MRANEPSAVTTSDLLPHGLPSTLTLIGGRRLAREKTFPVLDRYTQIKVADIAEATRDQVAAAVCHGDGRANVVARCKVVQEIHHEVPVAGVIPQMMMRIDDRQLGIDDLLLLQAQPFGPNR
jgi:hypothetical protein